MAESKRYQIKTSCPQCGCSAIQSLSPEEINARYGDVPNIELECSECMLKYHTPMEAACPEWDKECKLKSS